MRIAAAVVSLAVLLPSAALADTARWLRQLERGSAAERAGALRELAKEDPGLAATRAAALLQPNVETPVRRAAARTLWDLPEQAKPAEPALRAALADPDDDVAYAVVGALAAIGVPKADLRATRLRLVRSSDGFIALYAARALHPDPQLPLADALSAAFAALNLAASGRPSDTRARDTLRSNARALVHVVGEKSGREGFEALMSAFPRASPPAREAIAEALDKVPPQHGDPAQIAALLDAQQPWVRRMALTALIDYGERAGPAVDRMAALLAPPTEPEVRRSAAHALGRVADAPATLDDQKKASRWRSDVEARIGPALARAATGDPDRDVRKEAAQALQQLGAWAGPALGTIGARIAAEPDADVRHALVRACWAARASPQIPRAVLAGLAASDPDPYVRGEAKVVVETAP